MDFFYYSQTLQHKFDFSSFHKNVGPIIYHGDILFFLRFFLIIIPNMKAKIQSYFKYWYQNSPLWPILVVQYDSEVCDLCTWFWLENFIGTTISTIKATITSQFLTINVVITYANIILHGSSVHTQKNRKWIHIYSENYRKGFIIKTFSF